MDAPDAADGVSEESSVIIALLADAGTSMCVSPSPSPSPMPDRCD